MSLSYTIWLTTFVMQSAIMIVMLRNSLFRGAPIFFAYTITQLIRSPLLFAIHWVGFSDLYFYGYWGAEFVSDLFAFGVIYELFNSVLMPYEGLRELGWLLWRWSLIVLVLISAVYSAYSNYHSQFPLVGFMLAFEQGVHIMQVGLVLFLLLFSSALALTWRHYSFGLAIGFGILATVALTVSASLSFFGASASKSYILLKPGAYLLCCTVWLSYLLRPIVNPHTAIINHNTLDQLEDWNQAVLAVLRR